MKNKPKFSHQPIKPHEYLSIAEDRDSAKINKAVRAFTSVATSDTATSNFYSLKDLLPKISAKQPFSREDYEHFRPGEAIPKKYPNIIKACDAIYIANGIIRNVVDLMSDFGCQGIRLSHVSPKEQKFYNDWFEKVNGPERSERFLSCLYRHNMVAIKSSNARIPQKYVFANNRRSGSNPKPLNDSAKFGVDNIPPDRIELEKKDKAYKRVIPIKYIFLHPACVNPKNSFESLKQRPEYVYVQPSAGFERRQESTPLSPETTSVYFYKKDDWQGKPVPFLFPLIQHAIMIDKLNLADSAALDGATSRVRIFKLGDIEHNLFPSDAVVEKLDEILRSNVGGGSIDIIWGPDIKLEESKVDINAFLGSEKFEAHWRQLYTGLGIPPTLIGLGGGTTNNYISLKTFIQRLIYGREQLTHFWSAEIRKVQRAMGFSKPAVVEFDYMDLGDEASHQKLLLDMLDRNLISEERLQLVTGHNPDIENARIAREEKQRAGGKRPTKTSPYHDPQFEVSLKKIALQKGYITPEQSGITLPKDAEVKETPWDQQLKLMEQKNSGQIQVPDKKIVNTPGRPKNAKDTQKRKTREFSPRIRAAMEIWANQSYSKISDLSKPIIFKALGKSNLRQLNNVETDAFEKLKFSILCNLDPFDEVSPDSIKDKLSINKNKYSVYKSFVNDVKAELQRSLTLDELRQIQIITYFETLE